MAPAVFANPGRTAYFYCLDNIGANATLQPSWYRVAKL
jgi:hypothetical protein